MGNRGLLACVYGACCLFAAGFVVASHRILSTTTNKTAPAETLRDPPHVLGRAAPHASSAQEAGAVPSILDAAKDAVREYKLDRTLDALEENDRRLALGKANLHLAGPDYQPTRERFLDLGASLAGIEPEELWDLDETFWERWPQYEHLRRTWTSGSLSEAVGVVVDPQAELERLWEEPGVQDLWVTHQVTAWRRANAMQGGLVKEVAEASRYMDSLRRLIWREGDEVYQWLYECDQETR